MSDGDSDFTEDELLAMAAGSALMEAQRSVLGDDDDTDGSSDDDDSDDEGDEYKRGGGLRYVRIHGVAEPGSFSLPRHAVEALGHGDLKTAGAVLARLFRVDPDDPTTIPAKTVKALGNGNAVIGRRILERFVGKLRTQRRTRGRGSAAS